MDELQYAAYCGDVEGVRFFLAKGLDSKAFDDFGYTALHWNVRMACTPGERCAIVDELVAAGADVNHLDHGGLSVMDSALDVTAPN
jgi:ankyrin repeat protein